MNTNKKITVLSLIIMIIMISIAFKNRQYRDVAINISSKISLEPTMSYNLNIKEINKDDLVVKINVTDESRQANNSIVTKAHITKILQGSIKDEYIYIYDKSTYHKNNNDSETINVYSNNVLIPNKEYIVVLEKISKKFFYMSDASYKLKDDLSVFVSDPKYCLINDEMEYSLKDAINFLYFFSNEEQVKQFKIRKHIFENFTF